MQFIFSFTLIPRLRESLCCHIAPHVSVVIRKDTQETPALCLADAEHFNEKVK